MTFEDFEYDGMTLSDMGYIVCDFNGSNGFKNVTLGSVLTFNKIKVNQGKKYLLASSQYDECIEDKFQICKNPCNKSDMPLTDEDIRQLMRWLNRREFLPFTIISDDFQNIHFEATFNIEKIVFGDEVYGLELSFLTNSPFAYADVHEYTFDTTNNPIYEIYDSSDEIGDTDLEAYVTCLTNGDLIITNRFDGSETIVRNCISGETIHFKDMLISTDDPYHEHTIMNDFNWVFPQIKNTYRERLNVYEFSIPCEVTFSYSPIIKVGV